MKELEFVKYLTRKFRAKRPVVKGIGDDCAVLDYTRDKYMLLTSDMIAEGTHFTKGALPFDIGWKAMAVNISDIASMGGVPKYALVSLGVSPGRGIAFLKGITKGIRSICSRFDIEVIGGDTNRAGKTVLSIALLGEVEKPCLVKRDGAKPGDFLFVTGVIGEGKKKHMKFMPRLLEARELAKNFRINSMIDLSDGLGLDLQRLTGASSVGARIYKELIPLSKGAGRVKDAIYRGEDFELLFSASPKESKKIVRRRGKRHGLSLTLIGEIVKNRGVWLIGKEGKGTRLEPGGYEHFK